MHRDTRAAEAMLVRLGDLLRAVFRSQVQQEVPFSRELTLLEQYLDIQRVRFGGQLRAVVEVGGDAGDVLVPVLILQPLAENAIKHGFSGRPEGGTIRVTARRAARADGQRRRVGAERRVGGLAERRRRLIEHPGAPLRLFQIRR